MNAMGVCAILQMACLRLHFRQHTAEGGSGMQQYTVLHMIIQLLYTF